MTHLLARTFYHLVRTARVPVTLGLSNIYILPTRYGLIFLAGLGAMLAGSINYNNNLGFLLTFLLGSLALTAMLVTYFMLYGMRLVSAAVAPAFAGEPVTVEIAIHGGGRRRRRTFWAFEKGEATGVDEIDTRTSYVAVAVPTHRRGRLDPGWLRIGCEYPLGLFRAWSRVQAGVTGIVYPAPVKAQGEPRSHSSAAGGGQLVSATGVDDFTGLRTYQPGDPPRRIHWQAYSRGRGLHVKTFGGQAGSDWLLELASAPGKDLETKLSWLCYQVLRGYRLRCRVGLNLGRQAIATDSGPVHRDRCLTALALYGEA